jgi:imidazolonepropionase-like amidohydrolase
MTEVFGSGAYTVGHGVQAFQFSYYVKWGMTPAQALRMATSIAAEGLNFDLGKQLGTVEKGNSRTWWRSPATRSWTSPKWNA